MMLLNKKIERKIHLMKKNFRVIASLAAMTAVIGIGATASAAFVDMPSGDMGTALEHAIEAGLMNGVSDKEIAPDKEISRAEMATIIVRAFGAEEKTTEKFNDIAGDEWYADSVSKSAKMGAFKGDNGNFRPADGITFQETYLVLSRVFGLEARYIPVQSNPYYICTVEDSVLDSFADKGAVASWAVDGAKYLVGNGGYKGIGGALKPTDKITRGEFAMVMDQVVGTYIDKPGTYNTVSDGVTMVRSGGVVLDGVKTDKNVVITYGVDESGCTIKNSEIGQALLILGGADKTPVKKTRTLKNENGEYYTDPATGELAVEVVKDENGNDQYVPDDLNIVVENSKIFDVRLHGRCAGADLSAAGKGNIKYADGISESKFAFGF